MKRFLHHRFLSEISYESKVGSYRIPNVLVLQNLFMKQLPSSKQQEVAVAQKKEMGFMYYMFNRSFIGKQKNMLDDFTNTSSVVV